MISKRKALIGAVVLVLITNILTFGLSTKIQIQYGQKKAVPIEKYNELVGVYNAYSKNIVLKEFIEKTYLNEVNMEELAEGELKGLFQALGDPYSVYMTKEEFDSFMEHTKGTYGGIGVIVTPGEDNLITVVSPIEDTPGERAGLRTGDKIIKVNDREFTADRMDEAIKIMKGKPGTDVILTILRRDREGASSFFDVSITREEIRLKTVKSEMIKDDIGYIRISSFDELTHKDFKEHLSRLEKRGIKGLIIDLRNNPGGLLDVCAEITDELIDEGTIVYTETKDKRREYIKADKKKIDIPLTVLVNGGSASASEIMAGAIKDTNRGTLVGTKTFGKGIVQRIRQLNDGSGFKITVSEYFTPSGVNIHGVGIEPHITVELPEDIMQIGVENIEEDLQLKKAVEIIEEKIR